MLELAQKRRHGVRKRRKSSREGKGTGRVEVSYYYSCLRVFFPVISMVYNGALR